MRLFKTLLACLFTASALVIGMIALLFTTVANALFTVCDVLTSTSNTLVEDYIDNENIEA